MVVRKGNKLRLCIDPRDLNKALKRSHYPMPTIEEVLPELSKAKIFSVADAKNGFWQIKLDEPSSYLTTFWTPFGAALLQNGQPVAFASRTLSATERGYAQIEKEYLAIVFSCERFHQYIFGREVVAVQTDHKPLESIFTKPLTAAPKRLQGMLLRLQKFSLAVGYKRGTEMWLADTLSRAPLPYIKVMRTVKQYLLYK